MFSQTDEDGILDWLIRAVRPAQTFVEFGVHDYRESNTRFLLLTRNWSGLVIDGDAENIASIRSSYWMYRYDLQAKHAFITTENINALIEDSKLWRRLGLLSVDIDGMDYWVLERIEAEADIIVVEYNDFLGSLPVSVPYQPDFRRLTASPHGIYWGASLQAFRHLLERRGYVFVGTNIIGVNAFFVHRDHAASVLARLGEAYAHPCKMREARDAGGRLALERYTTFAGAIADLPLVRVDTGAALRVTDALAA